MVLDEFSGGSRAPRVRDQLQAMSMLGPRQKVQQCKRVRSAGYGYQALPWGQVEACEMLTKSIVQRHA
jgi:hypothetical protein